MSLYTVSLASETLLILAIALSVRSTNVYEEQALGVYNNEDPKEDAEPTPDGQKASKPEIFR